MSLDEIDVDDITTSNLLIHIVTITACMLSASLTGLKARNGNVLNQPRFGLNAVGNECLFGWEQTECKPNLKLKVGGARGISAQFSVYLLVKIKMFSVP